MATVSKGKVLQNIVGAWRRSVACRSFGQGGSFRVCDDRLVGLIDDLAQEAPIRLDLRGALSLVAIADAPRLLNCAENPTVEPTCIAAGAGVAGAALGAVGAVVGDTTSGAFLGAEGIGSGGSQASYSVCSALDER
jgi:hypothetical protein